MKALGIYIFQGGFTLGVKKHFNVVAHFEDGKFGVDTVNKNMPKLPVHMVPSLWPIDKYRGVDYVFGNPPCAPWSNAGSRVNRPHWKEDPLSAWWLKTAATAFELDAKVIAIESVRPLYKLGREMLSDITRDGRKHGYQATVVLENAIDCNLPQKRPRMVLILSKYQYLASPTRGVDVTPRQTLERYYAQMKKSFANDRTANQYCTGPHKALLLKNTGPGEYLIDTFDRLKLGKRGKNGKIKGRPSHLAYRIHPDEASPAQIGMPYLFTMGNWRRAAKDLDTKTIESKVLRKTSPGRRLNKVYNQYFDTGERIDGKAKGRPSMLKYRIHPDKPSPTQPGGAILFHQKEHRYLTIGEAAALCGYPSDYEFVGSISNCYAQMGKAVLPPVGEHLAKDAAATIRKKHKLSKADIVQAQEIIIYRDRVEIQNIIL